MKYIFFIFFTLSLGACQLSQDNQPSNPILELSNSLGQNSAMCQHISNDINTAAIASEKCKWLSDYGLFEQFTSAQITPRSNGIKYQLNSELFTDFAKKDRFIFLPDNTSMTYQTNEIFEFPLNSVIVKVFSLPQVDTANIIEIRLLIKRATGWIFLPYVWLEEKQDAFLYQNGIQITTSVVENEHTHPFEYHIPSHANCGECHQIKDANADIHFQPIGPKAHHLNKQIEHHGQYVNQLSLWQQQGYLTNLPDDLNLIDTAPNWKNESANLQDRAKAYLDINCAHCHNENGSAALSGLRLEYWRKSITHAHGVCNSSHGWRGGGFDIWPGRGEISSIPIRMRHTDAKDRMPPIGRSLVDEQAAQLISDWIDSMPLENCAE